LSRIPLEIRPSVIDIIHQSKSSPSQKRALLLKKGLLRSVVDELEALSNLGDWNMRRVCHDAGLTFSTADENADDLLSSLERISSNLFNSMITWIDEIKLTISYAHLAGVTKPICIRPLMLGSHHEHFKDGVRFEVVRRNKRFDVLAAGGRCVCKGPFSACLLMISG
jgi:eukaryotic translation initiation factor 2-alpha kinase 4